MKLTSKNKQGAILKMYECVFVFLHTLIYYGSLELLVVYNF